MVGRPFSYTVLAEVAVPIDVRLSAHLLELLIDPAQIETGLWALEWMQG
jgi:hypothetical protein